ncbi:hypothetical protein [Luteimonas salinilitoris]
MIPGARTAGQARQNARSMRVRIPGDFWAELKADGLIEEDAPVPTA